jgi:uncharacterized protein YjbJ (UPF0337 family)
MTNDTAGNARRGLAQSVKGKAKEVAGALTGNDSLATEGQLEQREAAAERDGTAHQAIADAEGAEARQTITHERSAADEERAQVSARTDAVDARAAREADDQRRVAEVEATRQQRTDERAASERARAQIQVAAREAAERTARADQDAQQALIRHAAAERDVEESEADADRARQEAHKLADDAGLT